MKSMFFSYYGVYFGVRNWKNQLYKYLTKKKKIKLKQYDCIGESSITKYNKYLKAIKSINKFDYLHSTDVNKFAALLVYLAKKRGMPFLYNLHGDFNAEFKSQYTGHTYLINKFSAENILKMADKVVFPSEFLAKKFRAKEKHVIPNPIDVSTYDKTKGYSKQHLGMNEDDVILTCVTHFNLLEKIKPLIKMLKAFTELRKTNKRIRLLICGDGAYNYQVSKYLRSEGVLYLGYRKDVPQLLKSSDIFVYPSGMDTFAYSVLEAMASGLPVIASNIGGIPEVADDSCAYLIKNTKENFRKSMKELISDTLERKRRGRLAYKRASTKFSVKTIGNQYYKLIKELCEGKK